MALMRQHQALFQVSLSNGETIFEGKGDYQGIEGQPSPWQRLLSHLAVSAATITSLAIYAGARRYMLPSVGKGGPNFIAYQEAPRPIGFTFYRKLGQNLNATMQPTSNAEVFAVAQATMPDGSKLELWVSDENPDNCWTLSRKD